MTLAERIEKFNNLMGDIVPPEVKKDLLDKGFFTAPASTKYHGNYEGGLFDHSYMVARYLKKLTEECRLDWQNPRSPLLVGMFHDLCKMDSYQHPVIAETLGGEEIRDDFKWEYTTDTLLKGPCLRHSISLTLVSWWNLTTRTTLSALITSGISRVSRSKRQRRKPS